MMAVLLTSTVSEPKACLGGFDHAGPPVGVTNVEPFEPRPFAEGRDQSPPLGVEQIGHDDGRPFLHEPAGLGGPNCPRPRR